MLSRRGRGYWVDMDRWCEEPNFKVCHSKRIHWIAQRNCFGQPYLTRNAMLEPNKDNRD